MRSLHQGAPLRGGLSETGGPMMPEPVLGERHAETIQQSHERCMTLGLNRTDRVDFPTLSRNELALARERNHRLYLHAAPVMETLFSQILDSQSMVVLTDANGTILHTIGPDAFLQRAAKVALSPGVNWSESTKGTNAIGTALIEELPTLVHGAEHFINANHFLTCSAAPILDPRGNILGVLDVTGDQHTFHPYTLGLVRMSVRMIENHWFSDDHRNVGHIYLHARPEFLGTLTEGILAVNPDGRIMGANRGAQEQLGMSSAALRMHTVTSLFGATMGALTERFRSTQAAPMLVETVSGRQLHLRARFNWPVWHSLSDTAADAVEATPAPSPAGMLPAGELSLPPAAAGAPRDPAAAGRAGLRTAEVAGVTGAPTPAGLGGALGSGPTSVSSAMPPGSPFGVPSGKLADAFVADGSSAGLSGEPPRSSSSRKLGLTALATGDTQMAALLDKLKRVLNRDIPILIQGETGTGKELLARALHNDSSRATAPFVAVNCASIPETLIESELFGYEEGAFTGARRKGAVGKMVQAHGGTLFLDEIGDMPLSLQAHLLRVLQEREVTPLGSGRAIPIDINLVCATHRNLREMIERKTFREDLYFRLNGLVVRIPPLRERTDLMVLVERILQRECPDVAHELAPDVVNLFQACRWQGNVRQLAGVLRTACVMAGDERFITRAHLSDDFMDDVLRSQSQAGLGARATGGGLVGAGSGYIGGSLSSMGGGLPHGPASSGGFGASHGGSGVAAYAEAHAPVGGTEPHDALRGAPNGAAPAPASAAPASLVDIELQTIRQAVEAARGNISEAAKQLGISRNTIYRKLHWQNKQH
ncbi:sigma 54-interacting transcriptional regulator [Aquabacterium sp.]|uniref:sigma-54-dependent Fis family transcriptional regulator n=1 Tax=Aquabacterium sp. TaxID=1872578 RepID=UPI0035C6FBF1